jgi:hypothetical protein
MVVVSKVSGYRLVGNKVSSMVAGHIYLVEYEVRTCMYLQVWHMYVFTFLVRICVCFFCVFTFLYT